jgi:uncharacterized protein with HEPN domain
MRKDDRIRMQHMLDAAKEAVSFANIGTRADLDKDRMLTLSIVKSVEIIGEAASKVTPEGRKAHPEIPWADIVAMRNRLIHVYFDIDLDRVWDTTTDDLPPLIAALERVLASESVKS